MREKYHDYRGYAGRIAGGIFKAGDEVTVLPAGINTKVAAVDTMSGELEYAHPPQSVTLRLSEDIDISRGDMIVGADDLPKSGQDIDMMVCWLGEKPMVMGGKYTIRHTTAELRCVIKAVQFKVDINTLEERTEDKSLILNEIARVSIKTTKPIFYDSYTDNRISGSISIIDEATNNTVGAGMII